MNYKNTLTAFLVLSSSLLATSCGMGLSLGIDDEEGDNSHLNDPEDNQDIIGSGSTNSRDIFWETVDAEARRTAFEEAIKQLNGAHGAVKNTLDNWELWYKEGNNSWDYRGHKEKYEDIIRCYQDERKEPFVTSAHEEAISRAIATVFKEGLMRALMMNKEDFKKHAEDSVKYYSYMALLTILEENKECPFRSYELAAASPFTKVEAGAAKTLCLRARADLESVICKRETGCHNDAKKCPQPVLLRGLSTNQAIIVRQAVDALKSIALAAAAAEKFHQDAQLFSGSVDTSKYNAYEKATQEIKKKVYAYGHVYSELLHTQQSSLEKVLKALEVINQYL